MSVLLLNFEFYFADPIMTTALDMKNIYSTRQSVLQMTSAEHNNML